MSSRKHLLITGVLVTLVLSASSCGSRKGKSPPTRSRPLVIATNFPLYSFARLLLDGVDVEVEFPAPADIDPAFWQPSDKDVQRMQSADLILTNGAGYEKWLDKVFLSSSKVVDTSKSFADRFIETKDAEVHKHGPEGDHSHAGTAFTTWLAPHQAIAQADAVRAALTKLLPEHASHLQQEFDRLKTALLGLDQALTDAHKNYKGAPLLASHPVYQYLSRRCKWNLHSLHWEPDTVPDEKEWASLEKLLKQHPAKLIIWEGEPAEETRKRLQALNIQSVVFDPCGNRPDDAKFLNVMKANIARLQKALAE